MRIGRNEIVEELTGHMRQCGGEPGEWCVGAASAIQDGRFKIQDNARVKIQDEQHGRFKMQEEPHGGLKIQDEAGTGMPQLAYREAHTPYAAADAADYLASAFGLRRAPGSTPGSVVYVYHAVDFQKAEGSQPKAENCKHLAAT